MFEFSEFCQSHVHSNHVYTWPGISSHGPRAMSSHLPASPRLPLPPLGHSMLHHIAVCSNL